MRHAVVQGRERSVLFSTPCGFEIALYKNDTGMLGIRTLFGGHPVVLENTGHRLSKQGALQLSRELERIYGDGDTDFKVDS